MRDSQNGAERESGNAEAGRESQQQRRRGSLPGPPSSWQGWWEVWAHDLAFAVSSHRRLWGWLIVAGKRLLGGLWRAPLSDVLDRQRYFNLAVIKRLDQLGAVVEDLEGRVNDLEGFFKVGIEDLMRYNDGLFTRVDQKLERYRREVSEHTAQLRLALTELEQDGTSHEVARGLLARDLEQRYVTLEDRHRGTVGEIAHRIKPYLPELSGITGTILDLGCGRGEALEVLRDQGLDARGVDSSEAMVRRCQELGLDVEHGDLLEALAARGAGTLGGVVCFHVIEHLDHHSLRRLIDLAFRALAPGGVVVFETPSALSLVAAASRFWIDPTHQRPVHPEALRHALEASGFEGVEVLPASPFPRDQALPEISLERLDPQAADLADRVNRLRDRLDELLFGDQDIGVVARKPLA